MSVSPPGKRRFRPFVSGGLLVLVLVAAGGCGSAGNGDDAVGPRDGASLTPALGVLSTPISTPTATAIPASVGTPTVVVVPGQRPTPALSPAPSVSIVTVGEVAFKVDVSRTPAERNQGLSGRDDLPPQTGMLFVFQPARASTFWMKGMLFPLDFVWIGEDCTVVGTTPNAPHPAPETPDSALPPYHSPGPVAHTLEINAGEVELFQLEVWDRVRFSGFSANGADC